ncbi:MAG: biotin--[acetyl-CoA-carboxylase] ligase [Saprospirales bacterium]|nr:biotin--[acetyl-CoA-carboxylase] ligase [Saprospirales bacterium]MBK8921863.1 biotin--[acetyl-CoA-carboxylase] ligase [Saprospirales bacterium]
MANTLFIGKVYLCFDELPSTNDYAREFIAKSKPPEGTVVRAVSQSAGRGQFGSQWLSAAGKNLTLSIILYPAWLPATAAFRLSEAMALAVRDTVLRTLRLADGSVVRLKWPNDVYIGSKKVAGILIQNAISGRSWQSSIVGIGLNINQAEFSPELPAAGSLALASGAAFELEEVAGVLFECLEQRYLQLKNNHIAALRADYHACLLGLGEPRQFVRPGGDRFEGVIQGVADDGSLILRTGNGTAHFAVKEVQLV